MVFHSSLRQRKVDRLMRYSGPRQFQPYARRNGTRPMTVDAKRRLAWLAVFLVVVSLTENGLAGVARRGNPRISREQVFRVGRLAPTREG